MYAKLIQEKKLPWGATVLVAKFPASGTVSFVGSVRGGKRSAPSAELARVHAAMLLEGTARRKKKDIQLFLDDIGASLSFVASNERLQFSGRVHERHLEKLFALISEVLREPAFPAAELALLKKRDLAAFALAEQDTHLQADIAFSRVVFSAGHPNYQQTTQEARDILTHITRKELIHYHAKTIGRTSLILSLAGDLSRTRALQLADTYFKKLPATLPEFPNFEPAAPGTVTYQQVPIEHKASIDYLIGHAAGITSDHKDFAALLLGIQTLGNPSGFAGRLMKIVREEEGLTYGVYAYLSGFNKQTDGSIAVWGTFAPQLFAQGRASILREIKRIVEKGVTPIEAKRHRELYEARSRVQLSNSAAIARAAHDTIAQGYKLSRLDEFPKKMLTVTAKEINAALKTYLHPSKLCEAAAGPIENK